MFVFADVPHLADSLQNLKFALNRRDAFSEGRLKENTEDSSGEIRNLGELMEEPVSKNKLKCLESFEL